MTSSRRGLIFKDKDLSGTIKKPFKHSSALCYLRGLRGKSTN